MCPFKYHPTSSSTLGGGGAEQGRGGGGGEAHKFQYIPDSKKRESVEHYFIGYIYMYIFEFIWYVIPVSEITQGFSCMCPVRLMH